MARKTVRNNITSPELWNQVSEENKSLVNDFIDYLKSTGKADTTVPAYFNDLQIFMIWNLQHNSNKFFVDLNKRDIMKFQNHLLNVWNLGSSRVRRLKATLSSMSNFIESMLDDIYDDYHNIINKVPSPVKQEVREKTVLEDKQVDFLLNSLVEKKKYQQACAVALAVSSGVRKSEVLRFKVDYFKDENIIYNALYKTNEKIKTKGRGKGKFINKYVIVNKFKPYFDLWMKEREELGITNEELFVSKGDNDIWQLMKVSTLDSWAELFSKILGIDWYWHSNRHYFCTALCKCNIPSSVVKDIVGWENISMVDTYNDTEVDDELGKYFDADGIKQVEKKSLNDLK